MGGRGSGGHNSKGKLRDVQCARLDVHELAREGKLKLGSHGWLFGTLWFEVTGGPDAQHLVLQFPCRSTSGEQLDPIRQDISATGGKHILAGDTSCSRAPNATAQRAFCMLGRPTASGFLVAGNAPISPISLQWATDGTARRVVSRSCALGSNGERTLPCRSNREVCTRERTSESWDAGLPRGAAKAGDELRSKI